MGLDITAYERVTLIRAMTVQQANAEEYDPWPRPETLLYVDHPHRTQHDGMVEGAYSYEEEKSFCFRAGSYSGYNRWRSLLARLVGTTDTAVWAAREVNPQHTGPFVELINFADNEGFIGPVTSAKLAADFDAWNEQAQTLVVVPFGDFCPMIPCTSVANVPTTQTFGDPNEGPWFRQRYADWRKAFHLAAKGGAVKFH